MRIALLADLHANREAVAACLAHARDHGAERLVFLGDYVGYGADPEWVVGAVMQAAGDGAIAIRGNHDEAIGKQRQVMASDAQTAIAWTRGRLDAAARAFLTELPLAVEDETRLYVHSDASAPQSWLYVTDEVQAMRSLKATRARLTFCGHVHIPALYGVSATGKLTVFRPVPGVAIPLAGPRRWHAVLGSVGQPRDGNAAACYAMLDTARSELTYLRIPYDLEQAAAKIRAAGLPETLAARLAIGR